MELITELKNVKALRHKKITGNDERLEKEREKEERMKTDWRFRAKVIIEELPEKLRSIAKEKDACAILTIRRNEYSDKKAFDEKSKHKDLSPEKLIGCARKVFRYCKKQKLNPTIEKIWDSAGPHDFVDGYQLVVNW